MQDGVGGHYARVESGRGYEGLEGGGGRIEAGDHPVEQRIVGISRRQLRIHLGVHPSYPQRGIVFWIGGQGQHLAGTRVEGHHRPGICLGEAVLVCTLEALGDGFFRGFLQLQIHGQDQIVAWLRRHVLEEFLRTAGGIDLDGLPAVRAPQERIVGTLYPVLADMGSRLEPGEQGLIEVGI